MPLQSEKNSLRQELKTRRDWLKENKGPFGCELEKHFLSAFSLPVGSIVAGFLPIQSEPDLLTLLSTLHEQGITVCLPEIEGKHTPLNFRKWAPTDNLKDGPYGLKEPEKAAENLLPTHMLVPCIAVDKSGFRLGYGAAYYDITLNRYPAGKRPVTIAVAYDDLVVPKVPCEDHDIAVDYILTETGCTKVGTA